MAIFEGRTIISKRDAGNKIVNFYEISKSTKRLICLRINCVGVNSIELANEIYMGEEGRESRVVRRPNNTVIEDPLEELAAFFNSLPQDDLSIVETDETDLPEDFVIGPNECVTITDGSVYRVVR